MTGRKRYYRNLFLISILLVIIALTAAILGCIVDAKLSQKHYCYISILWIAVAAYSASSVIEAREHCRRENSISTPR